jgi:dTDP-4-dehydrorhamnose reductase
VRILILGASGMLGHAVFEVLAQSGLEVFGTTRAPAAGMSAACRNIIEGIDVLDSDNLHRAFAVARPQVVVNAVGLVKQLGASNDPLQAIPINSLLPHRLAHLCHLTGSRLIHVSTDCVFSGRRGMYTERDEPDAIDLYGSSKRLGEVDRDGTITLRTSIIGHELRGERGLVEWFLHAPKEVQGYRQAIFSGVTTRELARIMGNLIKGRPDLSGLFHVSADPISKYSLIAKLNDAYGVRKSILPSDSVVVDRSLDSSRFRAEIAYAPPSWDDMIQDMHDAYRKG